MFPYINITRAIISRKKLTKRAITYSGGQKGLNDFVSKITNKVVLSFLATTVRTIVWRFDKY